MGSRALVSRLTVGAQGGYLLGPWIEFSPPLWYGPGWNVPWGTSMLLRGMPCTIIELWWWVNLCHQPRLQALKPLRLIL